MVFIFLLVEIHIRVHPMSPKLFESNSDESLFYGFYGDFMVVFIILLVEIDIRIHLMSQKLLGSDSDEP